MVPLYAARIADLGAGDLVQIECACGHVTLLTAQMLATAGRGCGAKVAGPVRPAAVPRMRCAGARCCVCSMARTARKGVDAPHFTAAWEKPRLCTGAIPISGSKGRRDRSRSCRDCSTSGRAGSDR